MLKIETSIPVYSQCIIVNCLWSASKCFFLKFPKGLNFFFILSAIRVVSSVYLSLWIFRLAILIPACEPSSPAFLIMYSLPLNNNSNKKLLVLCLPCFFSRLLFFLFPLKSSTLKPRYVSTNQMYWTLKQMKDQRRTLVLKCVMDKIRHLIESN